MKTMRTAPRVGILAAMLLISGALFADHVPTIPPTAIEAQLHGRFFFSIDELSLMTEYVGRFEDTSFQYRYQSFTLGGYYRLLPNVKAGLFYRLQLGARHDDDWINLNPGWSWVDSRARVEHIAIADITPRFLLDFLPGRSWVFAVKTRYEYNFYNNQQSLLVRPGLTYFLVVDREPVVNISAQYATYFSLNFGEQFYYRHGPYLNVLYHITPSLGVDIGLAWQTVYWSESADFLASHPTENYASNVYQPWTFDLGLIYQLR